MMTAVSAVPLVTVERIWTSGPDHLSKVFTRRLVNSAPFLVMSLIIQTGFGPAVITNLCGWLVFVIDEVQLLLGATI